MSDIYVFVATHTTPDAVLPPITFNQSDYNWRIADVFKSRQSGVIVVGDLKLRATTNAVKNHLLCDGSAVSRTQFTELFRLIGTTEGAGDGATTFNLPNYLGLALTVPATAPTHTATTGGTVTVQGAIVSLPINEGPTTGGNVLTGGTKPRLS